MMNREKHTKPVLVQNEAGIWATCGCCGHKLWRFKTIPFGDNGKRTEIEIKCPSCKALNIIKIQEENKMKEIGTYAGLKLVSLDVAEMKQLLKGSRLEATYDTREMLEAFLESGEKFAEIKQEKERYKNLNSFRSSVGQAIKNFGLEK